ncbi:VanZ family protein [Paenibacillus aestuarii]|uniref:VanZ family protein n=1 Tax=Paenibacillus aestuarii TaxID=516965 RepID=A0ABW0K1W0_9BACL|nr:VanZ family protein [Paenibacillus aestuarii]
MSGQPSALKVLLYLIPVLICCGIIFGLSSQTHQQQDITPWIKKEVSDKAIKTYFSGTSFNYGSQKVSLKSGSPSSFVEFFIRKFAHLTIYGLLGLLTTRLFKALTRWAVSWNFLYSVLLCAAYAASDEYHQSFIAGRTSRPADVVLDTVGAALGILIYHSLSLAVRVMRKRKAAEW